jgi:hypothetical protein
MVAFRMHESGIVPVAWLFLIFVPLIAHPAPAQPSAELPFEFRENLIWIAVQFRVAGDSRFAFLLDTGASASVIDAALVHHLKLDRGRPVFVDVVGKTVSGSWPVRAEAHAGQVVLPSELLALDLRKLSAACSRRVNGLIGADFLRDRITEIDFEAGLLRFPRAIERESGDVEIQMLSGPTGFDVLGTVAGRDGVRLRVDTGCAEGLLLSRRMRRNGSRRATVGLSQLELHGETGQLRLGDVDLGPVPFLFHKRNVLPGVDGLIGNSVWSGFSQVTLDFPGKRLLLRSAHQQERVR